jgi:hypothetical protein
LDSALLKWLVNSKKPGYDPPNIGVYGWDRLGKCNTQDGAGGVVSYAWQSHKFVPGIRHFSAESSHDLFGCRMQVTRSGIISHVFP